MTGVLRVAWAISLLLVVLGGVAVSAGVGTPVRSGVSYLGGLGCCLFVVLATTWVVALVAVRSPALSLVVALGCYLLTVLGFAALLIATNPTVVETRAAAAGLGAGVLLSTVGALRRIHAPDTSRDELGGK